MGYDTRECGVTFFVRVSRHNDARDVADDALADDIAARLAAFVHSIATDPKYPTGMVARADWGIPFTTESPSDPGGG